MKLTFILQKRQLNETETTFYMRIRSQIDRIK